MKTLSMVNFIRTLQADTTTSDVTSFKKGQVITGEVSDVFSNKQAMIKVGRMELVTQLHTSLQKGGKYWFLVESTEPTLKLKVIENYHSAKQGQNYRQLLHSLGLSGTKERLEALQLLMNNKLPFQREQLLQTIHLVEKTGLKQLNKQVVSEIIQIGLPVTTGVYQAIKAKSVQPLTKQFMEMINELNMLDRRYSVEKKLLNKLNMLMLLPTSSAEYSMKKDVYLHNIAGERLDLNKILENKQALSIQPKSASSLLTELKQLAAVQLPLPVHIKKIFVQLMNIIEKTGNNSSSPKETEQLTYLRNQLMEEKAVQRISAFISQSLQYEKEVIGDVIMGELKDKNIINAIKDLAAKQLNRESDIKLINELQKNEANTSAQRDPALYFLSKLKSHSLHMGLHYEAELVTEPIMNGKTGNEQSLKGLLLQILENNSVPQIKEKAELMLQTINGLQLSSFREEGNFTQFSMQIPGGVYGIEGDAHLKFESRKQKNGQIDSSYCRVLFYLKLKNLDETIVDMNIIDRKISLTIYNGKDIKEELTQYRPLLEKSLHKLDYSLSSLHVKVLDETERKKAITNTEKTWNFCQGVDFRI